MQLLDLAALLVSIAALLAWVNRRFIGLPTTIGVMLLALGASLLLVMLGVVGPAWIRAASAEFLASIDFDTALLHGMLSFLLFAGALHVDLDDLRQRAGVIAILATVGIVLSMFAIGGLAWIVFGLLGLKVPFVYCLLFGALISPTDPVAVLGILRRAGVPRSLEAKIAGESLFNDGVGVVLFLVLARIASGETIVTPAGVAVLFVEEAIGGVIFGLAAGFVGYAMLRSLNDYTVEILVTVAMVMGGYALAQRLHVSGPIAMVVAGLLIGNHGRMFAMSAETREHLDMFWELIDEILNAVLFLLIGIEVLVLVFEPSYALAALALVPAVLLARFACVGLPVSLLRGRHRFTRHAVKIMTWGGLRGGISVALALSLPPGWPREPLVFVTYVIVVFSIVVQGLTVGPLLRRLGVR